MATSWPELDAQSMEESVKKLMATLKGMKVDKRCDAFTGSLDEIKKMLVFLPLIGELKNEAMRERHWDIIRKVVGTDFKVDETLMLRDVFEMGLANFPEEVEECTD
jgi:dynein heavy chain